MARGCSPIEKKRGFRPVCEPTLISGIPMAKSEKQKARATIRDVARLAGVSRATVTRALDVGRHLSIKDATREKVIAAAASLNYRPSPSARSLKSRRSQVIAIAITRITPSLTGAGQISFSLGDMLTAAFSLLQEIDYRIDPLFFKNPESAADSLVSMYHAGYFDALLVPFPNAEMATCYNELAKAGCLVIGTFKKSGHANVHCVENPLHPMPAPLLEELVRQKRRHIVSMHHFEPSEKAQLKAILGQTRLTARDPISRLYRKQDALEHLVDDILAIRPKVDAILVTDEFTGWNIYKALHKRGVDVPGEITVTGAGDIRRILKPLPLMVLYYAPHGGLVYHLVRHLIKVLIERGELSRNIAIPPARPSPPGRLHRMSPRDFARAAAEELRTEAVITEIEKAILAEQEDAISTPGSAGSSRV